MKFLFSNNYCYVHVRRFLKSRPNIEEFLESLLQFQHFRQFINGRIEQLKTRKVERDIFDNEVLTYEEGGSCDAHVMVM